MPLVTLLGEKIAKEGEEFVYIGPNNDCRNCKLKTVCFNLKPGRKYETIKIRDKQHSCSVHEGNVRVVEVREMPIQISIEKNLKEGTTTKIEKKECRNIGCSNYYLCSNIAIQKEKTYRIIKTFEEIECPLGYKLKRAELTD